MSHKLKNTLMNNTYRIQTPVMYMKGRKTLNVLSYQTDKVYEVQLEDAEKITLSTFTRLLHQADIRNQDPEDVGGEVMVVDKNVI